MQVRAILSAQFIEISSRKMNELNDKLRHIQSLHDPALVYYLKRTGQQVEENQSLSPYVFPTRNRLRLPEERSLLAGYFCIDTFTPIHQNAFRAAKGVVNWTFAAAARGDHDHCKGFGRAGTRPTGTDRFTTGIEPVLTKGNPPPGQLCFYSYWPEMKQSSDGKYWGNRFKADPPFFIERDKWYCFEMMVKLNKPGERDGEQALWVDGKEIIHEMNFRWRDSGILKLNLFKCGLYIHYSERDCSYWIDDLVISTDCLGPFNEHSKPTETTEQ